LTRRLAPDGLPSLAQHGQAGCAGGDHDGGPSRGRGSRALVSVAGTRPTVPLDELARCSRTALRSTALRCAPVRCARARSSPRPPAMPGAGPPETMRARAGSTAAPVAALRSALWHVGRRGAGPRDRGRAARGSRRACWRRHAGRGCSGPLCTAVAATLRRLGPPRSPQLRPRPR
jgi:hypothetical protein